MSGRPCERCGNSDQLPMHMRPQKESYEYGDDEDDEDDEDPNKIAALCSEVEMAYGLLGWLCHDCRKEYYRMSKSHPHTRQYGEANLRLEFWKARIGPSTKAEEIDEGVRLWQIVEEIEHAINEHACKWLISDVDDQRSR